jgi:hypothetical protein
MEKEGPPGFSKGFTRFWLMHESPYFRDELIEAARSFDEDNPGSETSLRALARLDYETAKPILEAFASAGKPLQKSIAWSLLYGRAQQDGDSAQIEKYGTLLRAIVSDKQSTLYARQTALSSLLATEWKGQEEWVVSLFADPTRSNLHEAEISTNLGILAHSLSLNAVRWVSLVSNLVGHEDQNIHKSAVRVLVHFLSDETAIEDKNKRIEIAQRLFPLLTDPNWASSRVRGIFLSSRLFHLRLKKNHSIPARIVDRGVQHSPTPQKKMLDVRCWHRNPAINIQRLTSRI